MFLRVLLPCVACLVLAGCRTTKDVLNDYEANISYGKYDAQMSELTELSEKADGSQQMWRLMTASSLYLADRREEAVRQFDLAEDVFRRNDQTSVFAKGTQGTLAMLGNDKSFDYDGGGLDRVFTCVYRAIDFMTLGNRDNARVEFNRALQYQSNWLFDRKRDIAAAEDKMRSDVSAYQRQQKTKAQDHSATVNGALANASFAASIRQNTGYDPATSGNVDQLPQAAYCNAYATHLAGVFRWLNGDGGRDELKLAAALKPSSQILARDFAECDKGVRPQNQVWIWVEDGLCPVREEWRLDLPLVLMPFVGRYLPYAGMALPVLRMRNNAANSWTASVGGIVAPFLEVEDVDRLVRTEYDVYMSGALPREITRAVVKAGVQVALGVTADNVDDSNTRMALKLSQYAAAAWAASTVGADIRSWTALPKRVLALRLDRPKDGRMQLQSDAQPILLNLPEGNSLVFVRRTSSSASAVVKVASWR